MSDGSSGSAWQEADAVRWFSHYDDTHNGRLTRDQLVRALVQSVPQATLETADRVLNQLAAQVPALGQPGPEAISLEQFLTCRAVLMIDG